MKSKLLRVFNAIFGQRNTTGKNILLVDKPKGITSFDVIRKLRKELGVKKLGHAGTLDPLASGLLLVGVGDGTKKLTKLIGLPKTYEVEILFGRKTTTGDMEGGIIESRKVEEMNVAEIISILRNIVGKLELQVPLYSAVKKNGKPLYWYARNDKKIDLPVKTMEVYDAKLKKLECKNRECVATVVFDVSSGTYIRSLAEEVGKRINMPATVKELRRTKIGDYNVEKARSI